MNFTSTLALFLFMSVVSAIWLDSSSPDSVRQVAKALSINLRQYYTGDQEGDTPGTLPHPYYWWEGGAMFNTFIDYWYYTGDDQYNAITVQAMEHQIGDYNAFMPPNQTKSLGNDDQAFWGMAAMSAAENRLPDLGNGNPSWLALTQAVFNTQKKRWDNTTCGGGLRWQIFFFNNGYHYKNTISNGCLFNIAARLYKYLREDIYSDWAEQVWDWEVAMGLITQDYQFYDGIWDEENCTSFNYKQWTYNAGVHMAGAAAMWNVTQNNRWRSRLMGILEGTSIFFKDNIMIEITCEDKDMCNVDQRSFKAYLSRWMGYTAIVAPWTREFIDPRLQASAKAAAVQCIGGVTQTSCGLYWANNDTKTENFGIGEQMAALEVIQSLLYPTVTGPVSRNNGGISVSDPSAGLDITNIPITFNTITTGDKVGASVLTITMLVLTVFGAWWILSDGDEV